MTRYDTFFDRAALVRKVCHVARDHGFDGDIYNDEERIHRDASFEEKFHIHEVFKAVQEHYVLTGDVWTFVQRLVFNCVMNSNQSLRDRGLA